MDAESRGGRGGAAQRKQFKVRVVRGVEAFF